MNVGNLHPAVALIFETRSANLFASSVHFQRSADDHVYLPLPTFISYFIYYLLRNGSECPVRSVVIQINSHGPQEDTTRTTAQHSPQAPPESRTGILDIVVSTIQQRCGVRCKIMGAKESEKERGVDLNYAHEPRRSKRIAPRHPHVDIADRF